MATIGSADEFAVFKFPETGLVALCMEVTDLVRSGEAERRNLDLGSARYRKDRDGLKVVFAYKPEEETP